MGFSPDGTRIVSGSDDQTICVWDASSGVLLAGPFRGHTDMVTSVVFMPGGARVISSSRDNTIRSWDARSGRSVAGPFEGHTSIVNCVGLSPDGTRVVSGSSDMSIRVWDTSSATIHDSRPFEDWLIDDEGMITTRQGQFLLYVPTDLRTGLMRPQNLVCIYKKGSLALDFDAVSLGSDRVKCYRS